MEGEMGRQVFGSVDLCPGLPGRGMIGTRGDSC